MKKTIILTLAALMAFGTAYAAETTSDNTAVSSVTDKKPAKKGKGEMKEVTFSVHLHCANCVKKVKENISFEKGVEGLHVCLEDQSVSIKYNAAKTTEETLKSALEELGFKVSGKAEGGHQHHSHQ